MADEGFNWGLAAVLGAVGVGLGIALTIAWNRAAQAAQAPAGGSTTTPTTPTTTTSSSSTTSTPTAPTTPATPAPKTVIVQPGNMAITADVGAEVTLVLPEGTWMGSIQKTGGFTLETQVTAATAANQKGIYTGGGAHLAMFWSDALGNGQNTTIDISG